MKGTITILGHKVPLTREYMDKTSPWQYVSNWSMSDKGPHDTLEDLNTRMQNRWPGKYKIVVEPKWNDRNYYINEYKFKFDTPKDETWFKLQYP